MSLLSCVIGAAGHIDHGKTSLIEALTGARLDRLSEEKRRGITIDIGFADLKLSGGQTVGIVDVPGHQRFVHNMAAGAAGIDIALLVVAADDGVMPQTIEHLAILETLGISRGVAAVTKKDLVDEETLELALMDVAGLLEKSTLAKARIIPCSSVTGEGVEDIRSELERLALSTPPKPTDAFFRMPIDRVFTIKGHGVVVTGTVASGEVRIDDRIVIVPGVGEGRVRRIQNHGVTAQSAPAGTRTAINIAGPEKSDIRRGMVALHPAIAETYNVFTAEVTCHRSSPHVIAHGRSYLLHLLTSETLCRVYLAQDASIKPGGRAVAQLRFGAPLNVLNGDRFILRSSSARHTLGGGVVLEPGGRPMGKRSLRSRMDKWEALKNPASGAAAFIGQKAGGRALGEISAVFNLPEERLMSLLKAIGDISIFEVRGAKYACSNDEEKRIIEKITGAVSDFHEKHPAVTGIEESQLIKSAMGEMDEQVAACWIRRAAQLKKIEKEGSALKTPGRRASFTGDDEAARKKIIEAFRQGGLTPPKADEISRALGAKRDTAMKIIRALIQEGELVYIAPDFALGRPVLDMAKKTLMEEIRSAGHIETGRYRDLLGSSRKTAIDILEYFDSAGLTRRVDDKGRRVLTPKGQTEG